MKRVELISHKCPSEVIKCCNALMGCLFVEKRDLHTAHLRVCLYEYIKKLDARIKVRNGVLV